MFIKILGGIDIISALVLFFGSLIGFPWQIYFIFGILLIAKSSLGMLKDFASLVDFFSGVLLIIMIFFNIPIIIALIFSVLLIQKSVFSFI